MNGDAERQARSRFCRGAAHRLGRSLVPALLLLCGTASGATNTPVAEAWSGTARLGFVAAGFALRFRLPAGEDAPALVNEPDFGGRDVMRGALALGTGEADRIAFAWDREQGKLYLDVNGDGELGGEAEIFQSEVSASPYQNFEHLRLSAPGKEERREYLVSLTLIGSEWGERVYVTVHSGWRGELDLCGGRRQVAVVDNMDGRLDSNDHLIVARIGRTGEESAPAERLAASAKLFLDGHAYALEPAFAAADTNALSVAIRELNPRMAELQVQGSFVDRLILKGEYLVVLDRPSPVVPAPAGHYEGVTTLVADTNAAAAAAFVSDLPGFTLEPGGRQSITAGGPLTHAATAQRNGRTLSLSYRLAGPEGHPFQRAQWTRDAPRVEIYHDGRRVASGEFEYG